ncbi:EcsC family protein [Clavibacter michiganensis]|uniref:EcsC family protein n=2 Tax=Clavibacter michiganensis TaxID=28447 RepID=UPI000A36FE2B|nr:EcsC family protein [Clavibacter michiganensis]MWJ15426.1 hypothetical protein [Clavibacter michiganensis subsp. michiganensis]MWJ17621.1 hypothetical protein [Clavibacter michiganensis subsp. michiganensis]NIY59306.1 hypothetical protein [Clavibacter michiganensis subsp. michiganensis]QXP03199.1 EcsC family protein [Clavibacter michiganensis subsp. michiganensis]QXP06229.1 EcsC family protein [Clavibacter michiganensis subsp. michiganensis]
MSSSTGLAGASPSMSAYETQLWNSLNRHWEHRDNRRGLPNWVGDATERAGSASREAAARVGAAIPEAVKRPVRQAGTAAADMAVKPALEAALALVELVNDWAVELTDPRAVEKLARKRGIDVDNFTELRAQDLKACDSLLSKSTLIWRTVGAVEGGTMGVLSLVPVAGLVVAFPADVLVVQVMSVSIASRVAYSYGYDPTDPAEQVFIQRLVNRSFMAQAAKVKPLRDTARAASAIKDRVNWSAKLRNDHRLIAALEKLMTHLGPAGARVPVQHVAKALPFIGIVIGAGLNSAVLGNVAADARRYCQTRFLCDKYGLPLPAALNGEDEERTDREDA